jgi:uncharacterized membrane protein
MNRAARGFDVASLVVLGGAAAFTAGLYGQLPARVPTHFDLAGNANGWSDRPTGAWLVPAIAIVLWAVIRFARVWSPGAWRERAERSPMAAGAFTAVTLLGAVQAIILWASFHPGVSAGRGLAFALGTFMIAQSFVLPRLQRNPLIGIRDAWTLTSDQNWARTQRFAAYAYVAGGLVSLACGLVGAPPAIAIFALLGSAIVPHGYSYVVARQLAKTE